MEKIVEKWNRILRNIISIFHPSSSRVPHNLLSTKITLNCRPFLTIVAYHVTCDHEFRPQQRPGSGAANFNDDHAHDISAPPAFSSRRSCARLSFDALRRCVPIRHASALPSPRRRVYEFRHPCARRSALRDSASLEPNDAAQRLRSIRGSRGLQRWRSGTTRATVSRA